MKTINPRIVVASYARVCVRDDRRMAEQHILNSAFAPRSASALKPTGVFGPTSRCCVQARWNTWISDYSPRLRSPVALSKRHYGMVARMNGRDDVPENPIEGHRDERESARRIGIALTEAARVFGSSQQALEWMGEQILALHGQKPADVAAASEEGLVRVLQIIGRIDYGVYE